MAPSFDAVVFDAGGVLLIPTPEVHGPLVEAHGGDGSHGAIHRAHYAGMRAQDLHSSAEQDWEIYRRAYLQSARVPESALVAAMDAMREMWRHDLDLWRWPVASAVETLRALNRAGVPIAVVSNADGQIENTLAREAVCQVGKGPGARVEVVIDSHVVGVAKPDPAIFGHALAVLGFEPSRVLYIGDSVSRDVVGARGAGMVPLHLDPYDDHPDATHERIARLDEITERLR